jgi:hypothetical protein
MITFFNAMTTAARSEVIELIKLIQTGKGGNEAIKSIERATGNPNVWVIFDVLELDGMQPEKICDLICFNNETQDIAV